MPRFTRYGNGRVRKDGEGVENGAILLSAIEAMADANAARLGVYRQPHLPAEASRGKMMAFHSATSCATGPEGFQRPDLADGLSIHTVQSVVHSAMHRKTGFQPWLPRDHAFPDRA
jgi:hypothetical protein